LENIQRNIEIKIKHETDINLKEKRVKNNDEEDLLKEDPEIQDLNIFLKDIRAINHKFEQTFIKKETFVIKCLEKFLSKEEKLSDIMFRINPYFIESEADIKSLYDLPWDAEKSKNFVKIFLLLNCSKKVYKDSLRFFQ